MNKQETYTFSAGPGALPKKVLKEIQAEFVDFNGEGISLLEMSHRSKTFERVNKEAHQSLRDLLNIPTTHEVMFTTGGASTQFAAIPYNLLQEKKSANYLTTGHWGEKAIQEGKKYCIANEVNPIKNIKENKYTMNNFPLVQNWKYDTNGAYFHYCDNETIAGIEFNYIPPTLDQTLVCDMSSNFLSRPVDVSRYGLIYAGAQKNAGPSGTTIAIIRKDLMGKASKQCPATLDYKTTVSNKSLYNTGPTFNIYFCGKYFKYMIEQGGLDHYDQLSKKKSALLYDVIDSSQGFYRCPVVKEYRSRMNIPFLMKDPKLEKLFQEQAKSYGLIELSGHRSVGGCRASIYNGMPYEGAKKLSEFMIKFQNENVSRL